MIDSLLWALPAVVVVFAATTAAWRTAPRARLRRLLALNGLFMLGGGRSRRPAAARRG